jgi:hypothetical protein
VSRPLVVFSSGRTTTGWMVMAQQGISGLSTMTWTDEKMGEINGKTCHK